jgi:hypothetical protein
MIISKEELKNRLDIMSDLGVRDKYKRYLIDSVNDSTCADFISLVDDLSSKAWWLCASVGSNETKEKIEQHFEARKKVIDKYKERLKNVNI